MKRFLLQAQSLVRAPQLEKLLSFTEYKKAEEEEGGGGRHKGAEVRSSHPTRPMIEIPP